MNTVPSLTALTAAEALVLQNPQAAQGRATLKLTLMELIAGRIVTMRTEEKKTRFGRVQRIDYLHLNGANAPYVPGGTTVQAVIELLQAAGASASTADQIVQQAQRSFGKDLSGFQQKQVVPALMNQGLIESYQKKVLGLCPTTRYRPTAAGETLRQQLIAQLEQAKALPEVVERDPLQAAALVAMLGSGILLVDELKPHYSRLAHALRQPQGEGDDGEIADTDVGDDHTGSGEASFANSNSLDLGDFSGFDFDFNVFDALDSSLDAFDSSFDSSSDSGGNGGSDSGGSSG